jgi:DNA polymerase-3 subunit delta
LLGRAAGVLESLEKLEQTLAAGVPEGVTFLLSAFNVDKRRSFYKSLAKLSDVRVFDKVDSTRAGWEEEATRVIEERAGAHGLRFAPDALELLALLTGGDTRQVENEMEKVDIYLGTARRDVTVDDVRMLVPLSRAGVIFELGNALARRDPRRCLSLIDQLLEQGESAIGILLVAIVPTVRNLLLVKDLSTRYRLPPPRQAIHFKATLNRLSETALEHLPRKKDGTINTYPLGIAAMHAGAYELDELKRLLDQCLQANVRLVTSQLEPRIILGELVARLADKN